MESMISRGAVGVYKKKIFPQKFFKKFFNEISTLHSLLWLIDSFCKIIVPILWRSPFRNFKIGSFTYN